MKTELLCAGFGGQGVMLMGMLLSYAGMLEDRQVSWMPSYGPEQRGGTANCSVVMSDTAIGSPVVTEPDILVAMNLPSLVRFEPAVREQGLIIVNESMVKRKVERTDVTVRNIPATELAGELGSTRMANMITLGVLIKHTGIVSMDSVHNAMYKVFPPAKHELVPANLRALDIGASYDCS